MTDDDVARAIAAFEIELNVEHSDLGRGLRPLGMRSAIKVAAVAVLVALAAVLVAIGVRTASFGLWLSGLAALWISVAIDSCFRWRMGRGR